MEYAKLENNTVINIIVVEKVENLPDTNSFIEITNETGSASSGFQYDTVHKIFIPPSPYPSWIFNYDKHIWESSVPMPSDAGEKIYLWDELNKEWKYTKNYNVSQS
jgi:hypothetical protein